MGNACLRIFGRQKKRANKSKNVNSVVVLRCSRRKCRLQSRTEMNRTSAKDELNLKMQPSLISHGAPGNYR